MSRSLKVVGGTSWEGDATPDGNYDPTKVYAGAGRGASEMVSFRVSEATARFVQEFVGQRRHPEVKTNTDFFRDALYHAVQRWKKMLADGDLDTGDFDAEQMLAQAESIMAEAEKRKALTGTWTQALQRAIETGDRVLVLKTIGQARGVRDALPRSGRQGLEDAIEGASDWLRKTRGQSIVARDAASE
jgi:hypothetical protein